MASTAEICCWFSVEKVLRLFWQSLTFLFRSRFEIFPQITQLTFKCINTGLVVWLNALLMQLFHGLYSVRHIRLPNAVSELSKFCWFCWAWHFPMKSRERLFLRLHVDCLGCCLWSAKIQVCHAFSGDCVLVMLLYTAPAAYFSLFPQIWGILP